jgi:hypothetical protein
MVSTDARHQQARVPALGAAMLGARLYRRRNSPEGVATFTADGAVYVQRNDPDVAMLLGIGAYARRWSADARRRGGLRGWSGSCAPPGSPPSSTPLS